MAFTTPVHNNMEQIVSTDLPRRPLRPGPVSRKNNGVDYLSKVKRRLWPSITANTTDEPGEKNECDAQQQLLPEDLTPLVTEMCSNLLIGADAEKENQPQTNEIELRPCKQYQFVKICEDIADQTPEGEVENFPEKWRISAYDGDTDEYEYEYDEKSLQQTQRSEEMTLAFREKDYVEEVEAFEEGEEKNEEEMDSSKEECELCYQYYTHTFCQMCSDTYQTGCLVPLNQHPCQDYMGQSCPECGRDSCMD